MYSLKQSSFVVQGIKIKLFTDNHLSFLISDYFKSFFQGENAQEVKPLIFELRVVKKPPSIPVDSVKAINSPVVTVYDNSEKIYFASKSGSIICLEPSMREAKGFLRKEILRNPGELFSLLGASIVEALRYHGFYFLHAAALYVNRMAYLVSGDGGSGKTTTALSLVHEGFQYVSDDSLFLSDFKGGVIVSPMYKHFHIDEDLAKRFPEISGGESLKIPAGTKIPVDISKFFAGSFIPSLSPDIIIFPKITFNGTSALNPLTQIEVYKRLLKQTALAVDKNISSGQLKILEKLVKQTNGFELLSGRDIYEDPKKLISLLGEINYQNGSGKEV